MYTQAVGTTTYASNAAMPTAAPVTYVQGGLSASAAALPTVVQAAPQYVEAAQVVQAAPQYVQAAPQYTVAAPGSYVASPQVFSQAPVQQQVQVTTEGIPNPQQISVQQAQYEKALDKQLADGVATLEKEREIEKKMLQFSADKEIALVANRIQENLVESLSLVDEKATIAILELKKAAVERKLQLSAQAMNLTLDYEQRAIQMEWNAKRGAFEAKLAGQNSKLQAQIDEIERKADLGTSYAPGAQAVKITGTGFSKMALPSTGAPQGFEGNFQYVPA